MTEVARNSQIIDDYLQTLTLALAGLPEDRRAEIVEEVSEHIAEARTTLDVENEASLRALLGRIGDPTAIAAEAGAPPLDRGRPSDQAVPWLLLLGGLPLLIFAPLALFWMVGVVWLWRSNRWNLTMKLVGTFVLPGGLLPFAVLLTQPTFASSCVSHGSPDGKVVTHCTTSGFQLNPVVAITVALVALIAPLVTTWLLQRNPQEQ